MLGAVSHPRYSFQLMTHAKVLVIGVGGPLCSGKTTTANALHLLLPGLLLLHQDDFYLPDHLIPVNPEKGEQDWDCPEAIDFPKFLRVLDTLKQGGDVTEKLYRTEPPLDLKLAEEDLARFRPAAQAWLGRQQTLGPVQVVLVDGFMLYHDSAVAAHFDARLFIHAGYDVLKYRRENRNGYVTIEGLWTDPPGYFDLMVWPAYYAAHKHLFLDSLCTVVDTAAATAMGLAEISTDNATLAAVVEWAIASIDLHTR